MAEGGRESGYDDPQLKKKLDHDDDDEEEEVDRTRPFQPGAASTPNQGGETREMQTRQHETSGLLDTSYEETPLLERTPSISDLQKESSLRQKLKKAVDAIKTKFPAADFEKIKIRRDTRKSEGKIVAVAPKEGEYKILKGDDTGFMKRFLDSFKDYLKDTAEEIVAKKRDHNRNPPKSKRGRDPTTTGGKTLFPNRRRK